MFGLVNARPLKGLATLVALVTATMSLQACDAQNRSEAAQLTDGQACAEGTLGVARELVVAPKSTNVHEFLEPYEVVLTFDDGPDRWATRKIVKMLDAECTHATFFLLGRNAKRFPKVVRDIAASGHSIGSHSWSHRRYTELTAEQVAADLQRTHSAISDILGTPVQLFRYPFIAFNRDLNQQITGLGIAIVTVTVDGRDWERISPERSIDIVFEQLELRDNRGIILLHDPFDKSVQRTRLLLDRLKDEGYRVVAIKPSDNDNSGI
ncbi:MAG: polysaccharide deacetylase family protein [Pseudomonadota bacterium]